MPFQSMQEDQAGSGTSGYAAIQQQVGLSRMKTGNPVYRHLFDQVWIFGYFPHAPSLGISESFPIHVEELAKVNIARQVPMPINTVQDRAVESWYTSGVL
jgi:hypothetical protein